MSRLALVLALVLAAAAAAPGADDEPAGAQPPYPAAAEKQERRRRAAERAGDDAALLVLSAGESQGFTGSTQNDEFTYLSPLDARGAAVLVAKERPVALGAATPPAGDGLLERIYLRPRDPASETWNGPAPGPGRASAAAGAFDEAAPADRLAADVADLLRERSTLYVSAGGPADGIERLAALLADVRERLPGRWVRLAEGPGASRDDLAESLRRALPERLPRGQAPAEAAAALPVVEVRLAGPILSELREVKSESEIASIRAAVLATVRGIEDAMRGAAPGVTERQLQAVVELRCRLAGCSRQAFPSIVGSGPNSCVLHYLANDRTLADGDLVVLDVGGEFRDYASDVTRTFPASGRFSEAQAEVYDAVLAAQEAGLARVRPGAMLRDVHEAASAVLRERGLIAYFPHGTCHSVGLDVHDSWRKDALLRPGCVITVEPGAYIAAKSLGVRIEDTVLVTADGCEILSAGAPKTRAAIEALMAEDPPFPFNDADAR